MQYEIVTVELAEQPTAEIEETVPVGEISTWLPTAYEEVFGHLARLGVAPAGPPFARYLLLPEVFEVEAGAPVTDPVPTGGRVTAGVLPAGPVAMTTHWGPYEELGNALAALDAWIAEHDAEPAGAHWEIYHSDPAEERDPARWRTDVLRPYRPRAAG